MNLIEFKNWIEFNRIQKLNFIEFIVSITKENELYN